MPASNPTADAPRNAPAPRRSPSSANVLRIRVLMGLILVFAILSWFVAALVRDSGASRVVQMTIVLVAFALLFGFGLLFALAPLMRVRAEADRDLLDWSLAAAARRRHPLAPVVRELVPEFGEGRLYRVLLLLLCFPVGVVAFIRNAGNLRFRAANLAAQLEAGKSLTEAHREVRGWVTRPQWLTLRVGELANRLDAALVRVAAERHRRRLAVGPAAGRFVYLLAVLLVVQTLVVLGQGPVSRSAWIAAQEAGLLEPGSLPFRVVAFIDDWLASPAAYAALALQFVLFLPIVRLINRWSAGELALPFLSMGARRVAFLRDTALAVEARVPMPKLMIELINGEPNPFWRARLKKAVNAINDGRPWPDAFRSAGVLRKHDAALLEQALDADNLPWAARQLADWKERRANHRVAILATLLFVIATLLLALAVLAFQIAVYLPLAEGIHAKALLD